MSEADRNSTTHCGDVLASFVLSLLHTTDVESMNALIELDLTLTQARALFVLARHGLVAGEAAVSTTTVSTTAVSTTAAPTTAVSTTPMALSTLAEHLGVTPASTGRAVDQLVNRGLIERREDPVDRRIKRVTLTPRGREIAAGPVAAKRRLLDRFVAELDPHQRADLVRVLEPLIARTSGAGHIGN